MYQRNAATLTATLAPAWTHAIRPPEGKWSRRRTLLFILLASTTGWLIVLSPVLMSR